MHNWTQWSRTFFADIADQDAVEILQNCYVHSASLRIVATDLNLIIRDSIPRFLEMEGTRPLEQTAEHAGSFGSAISKALSGNRGELFLVLGGIGSGKTTFLKRYQRTVGKELLGEYAVWFYIDFLRAPLDPLDLEDFVWRDILKQLRDRYTTPHLETRRNIKTVFADNVQRLEQTALRGLHPGSQEYEKALGPYLERWTTELKEYVPGLLRICKPKKDLAVVIFVDNVDQLSPASQGQIFLLAQRVTRLAGSLTIVTLREESYYTASVQRTFTAYATKKFHIASPRFRVLIGNRITFALDVLRRSEAEMQVILYSGIELQREDIAEFLQIVQYSIFERNRNIARMIEAICFGNMRFALDLFQTFLTSGATDVDKMLHIYRREGAYFVAYHEFVKSIMLRDRRYYREEQSPIMNVFDCGSQRNASHFTALRILGALLERRGEYSPEGQGYVEIAHLIASFEDVFDNREDVVRTLNRLVSRQLLEVDTRSTESIDGATFIRVTPAGWYYSRYLVRSFAYLDLVLQDTPLNDERVERELRDAVFQVDNLWDREEQKLDRMAVRFDRVELFLKYLAEEEDVERKELSLDDVAGPLGEALIWRIRGEYERQRNWIQKRLAENRERYAEEQLFETDEEDEGTAGGFEDRGEEDRDPPEGDVQS